jgi:hypothetical protein
MSRSLGESTHEGLEEAEVQIQDEVHLSDCQLYAWAKPEARLICGACHEDADGYVVLMEPAAEEAQAA